MTIRPFVRQFVFSTISALVLVGALPSFARAQADHHGNGPATQQAQSPDQKAKAGALINAVREWTERFKDPAAAVAEHYGLLFGCVSGSDYGAMGLHYVNFPLVIDGKLDVTTPEIILYEPLPSGKLRITGADYLVLADAWDSQHAEPPQMMGQLFHRFESPNRFGLPAFYTLHVWAWKENPAGAFTNWNPNVSCDAFVDQND